MITGVWINNCRNALAVQWDGETITVTDYTTDPVTSWDQDVLGAEWETLEFEDVQ